MSLKFKVLWIDDTPEWVESIADIIGQSLEEEGFTYTPVICETPARLSEFLPDPEVTLVGVDRNLPGMKGDEVIRKIRENDRCVTILFYSQTGRPPADDDPMDGVYFRHRDAAGDMVIQLFQRYLEGSLGLSMTRGLLIAEAIDIENTLTHAIAEFMGPRKDFYLENVLCSTWSPYDFSNKMRFVGRALETMAGEAKEAGDETLATVLSELKKRIGKMSEEVLDYRNIFAHGEWFTNSEGNIALRGINKKLTELPFTREVCKSIRLKFKEHSENARAARAHLSTSMPQT